MSKIGISNALEASRLTKNTVADTVDAIVQEVTSRPPPFNYWTARKLAPDVIRARQSGIGVETAVAGAYCMGHPDGYEHNADVLRHIHQYSDFNGVYIPKIRNKSNKYATVSPKFLFPFMVGEELVIRTDFLMVQNENPHLVILQPRKGEKAPTREDFRMFASLFFKATQRSGFKGTEGLIIDVAAPRNANGRPGKVRKISVFPLSIINTMSDADLKEHLSVLAEALRIVRTMDLVIPERPSKHAGEPQGN